MGDLRERLAATLGGPDVESTYECAHCGTGHDGWRNDCRCCGGVLTRIVTDSREDDSSIVG